MTEGLPIFPSHDPSTQDNMFGKLKNLQDREKVREDKKDYQKRKYQELYKRLSFTMTEDGRYRYEYPIMPCLYFYK